MTAVGSGWRERVVEELTAIVERVGIETTDTWATGTLSPHSVRSRVTDDFVGYQDAPWFTEPFRAGREEWLSGTREAAELYAGQGMRWTTDSAVVLPRSPDEAVVSYRVRHHWPDERPPTEAMFLEVWVRRDGDWWLQRHTSEKA